MNIDDFLRRGGADWPAVIRQVNAKVGLRAGDVLLAVGSLAEDMGTGRSDLDLLLITGRSEDKFPPVDHVLVLVERCFVDVQLWRLSDFEKLIAKFNAWSQTPWDVTHAVKFSIDERTLLHRLLHFHLVKEDKQRRMMKQLPSRRELARLRLHVARQASRTIQVDMSGYREIRDYSTLVFAAQELLGHAVDALLASYELTNPLVKWRHRLLSLLPSDWDRSLGIRPAGVTAQQYVWDLHRAPERPGRKAALEHAFRITTFARAAFLGSELRLVQNSIAEPIAWRSMRMKPHDVALPYLDFDVDFLVGGDRFFLARLNEFNQPIEVSPSELRLTLLFDGRTTLRQAKRIRAGSNGHSGTVEELIARIRRAGLTAK